MSKGPWPRHRKIDFSKADWTLPNKEIAHSLGCSESHVSKVRNLLGLSRKNIRPKIYDFTSVRWNKTDHQIAEEVGCTLQLVRIRREERGGPTHHEKTRKRWAKRNLDPTQTVQQNANRLKRPYEAIKRLALRYNIPLPRQRKSPLTATQQVCISNQP